MWIIYHNIVTVLSHDTEETDLTILAHLKNGRETDVHEKRCVLEMHQFCWQMLLNSVVERDTTILAACDK